MPVGKGSITRATNASSSNHNTSNKPIKVMPGILTDIPVGQILSVPTGWMKHGHLEQPMKELVQSIQRFGVIEPVILRRLSDSQFQLLSGYRRLKAVKDVGAEFITARVIESIGDEEARAVFDDLHVKKAEVASNIYELKIKAVTTTSKDMPIYLL